MSTELQQDHDGLRRIMREFAHMMRTKGPEAMPEITRMRIAFSQLFREHMGREDGMIGIMRSGPMVAQGDPVAREHSRAMVALFLRYSDHIKSWTPAQIEADWHGYRDAVLQLQQDLFSRMEWEERYLHPLITEHPRRAA